MARLRRLADYPATFAAVLFLVLAGLNLIQESSFVSPVFLAGTVAIAMPIVLAAMAMTPPVLSGGGGIDLSVGPLMGLVNVLLVTLLPGAGVESPLLAGAAMLAVGLVVGAVNGWLVAMVRLQPIVATLGTYLVLNGINLALLPSPLGPAPDWLATLGGSVGGVPGAFAFAAGPVVIWVVLASTPFVRTLLAVGGEERAAFTAGIDVVRVRFLAYVLAGLFAAFAGLALTALIQSGDATVGPPFTLQAVTSVALGGTSLAGGRGGMIGSVLGALSLFLIQNLLTSYGVSVFWLQVVFGAVLVLALVVNGIIHRISVGRSTA